jgi:hypothetical protein
MSNQPQDAQRQAKDLLKAGGAESIARGLAMTRLLIENGADLSVRAKLPGHYEQPDEVIECTPFAHALRFRIATLQ